MGPAAFIVLMSIAFVSTFFSVGHVVLSRWRTKQVVEEERRFQAEFTLVPLPPTFEIVQVMAMCDGRRTVETACHEPDVGWVDPDTLQRIPGDVIGWRKHAFPQPRRDTDTCTEAEVKATLERMFAEDDGSETSTPDSERVRSGGLDSMLPSSA